jgi:hypothetical protein
MEHRDNKHDRNPPAACSSQKPFYQILVLGETGAVQLRNGDGRAFSKLNKFDQYSDKKGLPEVVLAFFYPLNQPQERIESNLVSHTAASGWREIDTSAKGRKVRTFGTRNSLLVQKRIDDALV